MKTSEQTKRTISVGLINAAWVVIVAAATLFCGVTAARADEPDNRIDWRWGRPGVMVVTNAPTAVTVTNIATTVATDVAGGVAENLFGPRVTALEDAFDGGTNNWNTAYGWGNHAGLYRSIDWVPSWTEVTGKPDLFDWNYESLTNKPATFPPSDHTHPQTDIIDPPWLTSFTETDEIALFRVTVLEGKTNNWNTAYGWGDHAGLYKASDWVPSWGDITDIPQDFPPSTHEHDYTAVTNPPWLTEYTETDEIALFRVTVLEGKTNNWNAAYGWGDWHPAVAQKLDITSTNGWETGSHSSFLTSAPPQSVVSVNGMTGAVVVMEQDLAALRLYHYGSPDIIESPTNWFLHDGAGTITGINAESVTNWNIVIPWEIGGVLVTEIGDSAFEESGVTSIVGAGNVVTVGDHAFSDCYELASVLLPQVQTVGDSAFADCGSLTSIPLPQVQTVGDYAFEFCGSLTSIPLPQVQTVGDYAFTSCFSLTSLYFNNNAPTIGADIFADITPNQVTNYVTNPQATGWGDTLGGMPGGMPVVRLPLHTDSLTLGGVTHTNWPSADVSGLATTQSVDAVAGDLVSATIMMNNHTSNGTIGSDGHASSAEKANWNGKLSASGGTASNLTARGWIAMPQSAPTNLVLRLVCSNEHIIVQEVYQ